MRCHATDYRHLAATFVALCGTCSWSAAYEHSFLALNDSQFGYTFGGFEQQSSSGAVRLHGGANAAGGAGIYLGEEADFTGFADSKVRVDFTVNAPNQARWFEFELLDVNSHAAKWRFEVQETPTGTPQQRVSLATLATPDSVTLSPDSPGTFDLSKVRLMQIVGGYAPATGAFDMTFACIAVETELAYPGAPDENWYAEANRRIDAHRKADLSVVVRDATGRVVPGATVHVAMQRHEYGFGTAIATFWINSDSSDGETYRQKLVDLFNLTTTENALKWKPWAGSDDSPRWSREETLAALDWLADHHLPVRGHNVIWPGEEWLPQTILEIAGPTLESGQPLDAAGQEALRSAISDHIEDVVSKTADKVVTWDVVNEPRANRLLMDALPEGDAAMVDWFNLVKRVLTDNGASAKLYLNEYNIVTTHGATDTAAQQTFFEQLQALKDGGAAIDGLGIQGHFRENTLTGPEKLWEIFDRYAALGLDIEITEFDFGTTNRELQAAYFRDFFTAAFAHKSIDSIVQWGFWSGAHFQPDAALFNSDWTLRPHGEAYVDLVFDQWWTDEEVATDAEGKANVRGFKGDYRVTAAVAGHAAVAESTLSDGGATVELTLDWIAGDLNRDGRVNMADYTVWQNHRGASVGAWGLGDANGDGIVNQADYQVWKRQYGASLATD